MLGIGRIRRGTLRANSSVSVVAPDGSLAFRAVGGREFDHPEIVQQLLELKTSRPGP